MRSPCIDHDTDIRGEDWKKWKGKMPGHCTPEASSAGLWEGVSSDRGVRYDL